MAHQKHYAGFWVRLFAAFLDIAVLIPFFVVLIYLFGTNDYQAVNIEESGSSFSYFSASTSNRTIDFISYGISIAYLTYFLATRKQATLGKRIMGIYVGNPDGSQLSMAKSLARAMASILTAATCGLGFVIIIFTKEKIALHDFLCNTRVFHGKKNVKN